MTLQAQQPVGGLALAVFVKARPLQNLREGQLLLEDTQPPAALPVQHRRRQEALDHQLAADELAVRTADVHPGGQDFLRAAPAGGQRQLFGEGELLLPDSRRHPGFFLLPEQLDAPVPLHTGADGQGNMAAERGVQNQIGAGQNLPGIQNTGIDATQFPPDVQIFAGGIPLTLPVALERDLKVEGAQSFLLFGYVQHRRFHIAAGAEAAVSGHFPAGEAYGAGGVHNAGNVPAAVRHDGLPHGLAGEGSEAERFKVVVIGFLQFQFHIWRPPFAYDGPVSPVYAEGAPFQNRNSPAAVLF